MADVDPLATARELLAFVDASPTPFHLVEVAGRRLTAAGFSRLEHPAAWPTVPDQGFCARDGALVAWSVPADASRDAPFRLVAAHTDSPNLRVKPRPDTGRAGWRQLGVEVYGSPLLNSWLDRDLGLAGRVMLAVVGELPVERLLRVDRPILRVPQLAIHLDRDISDKGLVLNRQQHLTPVWGLGQPKAGDFRRFLAAELEVEPDTVLAWDMMAYDLAAGAVLGVEGDLLASARLDNQCSCFAALEALAGRSEGGSASIGVVSLFDHEEVGSGSARGADGSFLGSILERISLARGGDRAEHLAALAGSSCVSADMAHATHPNYAERHDPDHPVAVNGGPVVKINANQRYATDAATQAGFEQACTAVGVPVQHFVSRNDMPCGSTIGPANAAWLGVPTVDVGIAELSMHSIRELCGAQDPALLIRALVAWLG